MTNDIETPTAAEAFGRNDLFPEEHDRVKLSAQLAVGNHSMLNIAESILAKENAALKEQVAQLKNRCANLLDLKDAAKNVIAEKDETIATLQSKSAALVDALENTVPYLWNSSTIGADVVAEQTLAVIKGAK